MVYKPDIAIIPGWTIRQEIENLGLSNGEFAERLGVSEKHLSQLLSGKVSLTYDIASRLEYVTGIKANFWNKLELKYQEDLVRIEMEQNMAQDLEIVPRFTCYGNLVALGFVESTRNKIEKLKNLLKFFRVSSLSILFDQTKSESDMRIIENIAYRKSHNHTVSKENLISWIKVGERLSQDQEVGKYKKSDIEKIIPELKELTKNQTSIDYEKIKEILNSVGIYFSVVEHFEKVPVNGISRLYNKNPLIQMSLRHKWIDIFWFTLFHELGHLYNGDLDGEKILIDYESPDTSKIEYEANNFASTSLISPNNFNKFIESKRSITLKDLQDLAETEGVGLNIIAGRITHELKEKQPKIFQLTSSLRPTIK